MARRQKPYTPSWGGDPIVGLYRCPDGRWRINATGDKFTCHDERQAIGRFLAWRSQQDQQREALIQIPLPSATALDDPDTAGAVDFVVRKELGPGCQCMASIVSRADREWSLARPLLHHFINNSQ